MHSGILVLPEGHFGPVDDVALAVPRPALDSPGPPFREGLGGGLEGLGLREGAHQIWGF